MHGGSAWFPNSPALLGSQPRPGGSARRDAPGRCGMNGLIIGRCYGQREAVSLADKAGEACGRRPACALFAIVPFAFARRTSDADAAPATCASLEPAPAPPQIVSLLIFCRGLHCPIGLKYLLELDRLRSRLEKRGVQAIALSSDGRERARAMANQLKAPPLRMGYGLSLATGLTSPGGGRFRPPVGQMASRPDGPSQGQRGGRGRHHGSAAITMVR